MAGIKRPPTAIWRGCGACRNFVPCCGKTRRPALIVEENTVPQDQETRSREQRFSVADHARALAVVLHEEFGVPFAFFNAVNGEPVRDQDPKSKQSACIMLQPAEVLKLTAEGRARVAPLDRARYQLSLLLYRAQEPILLAVGETAALAEPRAAGVAQREQAMWRGWLQAVSDRLRLADQLLSRRRAEA